MTLDERMAELEKTVSGFNLTSSGTNQVQGGFPEFKRTNSLEERIAHLETLHENFTILGGANVTVEGSLKNGFAICSTCPGDQGTGSIPGGGGGGGTSTGACCYDDGTCAVVTQAACESGGGTYRGNNSACDPNPCPQPTGACCVGASCSIETEADCTGMGGTYLGDGTICDPNPCGTGNTGACCHDTTCDIETQAACEGTGGTYLGDGTTCSDLTCACPCGFDAFDGSGRKFLTYQRTITGSFSSTDINDCPDPDGFEYDASGSCSATFESHFNSECVLTIDINSSSSNRTETLNGIVTDSCSMADLSCFCNVNIPEHNQCTSFIQFCHGCAVNGGFGGCSTSGVTATTKTTTCTLSGSCTVETSLCTGGHHENCNETGSYVITETLSDECIPV